MDLVTHVLFGNLTRKISKISTKSDTIALISATVVPDIGEIIIQNALAKKYAARFAVYDGRTSDSLIANDLSVTWFYDLFHSFFFAITLLIISRYLYRSSVLKCFSIGLLTHIFLDCATHGKVWALKLFFPLSNQRFEICSDSLGNWWDWKPSIELPILGFPFPAICFIIWLALIVATYFVHTPKTNT
ncbi:MAG: metal-dependent hydrolase [Saprospiraceae bacterium]|nr:metal-dependent hydrolase [Saprospiraceae bacterium]